MEVTESTSHYDGLDKMQAIGVLRAINQEDKTVPMAVEKSMPQIEALVLHVIEKMKAGGRLFYIGAGTSGRLGIVDASECPPTFGVPHEWVIGIIAGGDGAIRKAVEFAEDDTEQAWKDLSAYQFTSKDVLVGIAASGKTPYVIGGLKKANTIGALTGCITCNPNSPMAREAQFPIEVVVGPEVVTGSTRMKAGTAQKLVLNMISTTVMIGLGRVKGNKMVDMQLSNHKLVWRGTKMIMDELGVEEHQAKTLLMQHGNVRAAVEHFLRNKK